MSWLSVLLFMQVRGMFKAIGYVLAIVVLLVGYVKYLEIRGIFYPLRQIEFTPAFINLSFEDVYIETKDNIRLNGWFIPSGNAKYTILFCHGNAGNIQDRLDKISLLAGLGLNLFIIDYRGFGRSQGKPSERGLYLDAEAAYGYLVNNRGIKPEHIILYGESLGSAVVINLAASGVKIAGLIAEGAFSKGKDMAREIYPFLPTFFFSDKFDSLTRIKKIDAPILFIHSKDDEIVPLALAEKLYRAAQPPKQLIQITGDHNNAFLLSRQAFLSSIASFIETLSNPIEPNREAVPAIR